MNGKRLSIRLNLDKLNHKKAFEILSALPSGRKSEYAVNAIIRAYDTDEVLELVNGQAVLLIEIKGGSEQFPGIERRTVEAVEAFNAVSWTICQSFNEKAVERVNNLDPGITTYYLLGVNYIKYYREFRDKSGQSSLPAFGYDGLGIYHKLLSAGAVDSLQGAGLEVFCWTVNDVSDMTEMINAGVDGIITDSPDKLIGLIR